jgi:peroxiredoxin
MNIRSVVAVALGLAIGLIGCTSDQSNRAAPSRTAITPALIGTKIPDMALFAPDGQAVPLGAVLTEKPTVLVVYVADGCVYCQKQLADLQTIEPELIGLGYQIVAVSADSPQVLAKSIEARHFKYQLLSDMPLRLASALGLTYYVSPDDRRAFEKYGAMPTGGSAQPQWVLPVPSVFIVNTQGVIRWEYVNPNYTERVPPELLLAAARSLAEKK